MTDEMRADGHEPATKADVRAVISRLDGHDQRFDGHDGNLRRLNVGFARMECDMTDLKVKVNGLVRDFAKFSVILERISGNIESTLRKMDLQGSMLMEHEGRITKLESRPN